jgi:peptidoglycan lytic transglycosylase
MPDFHKKLSITLICFLILSACAHAPEREARPPMKYYRQLPKFDRNGMRLTDTGPGKPPPPAGTVYQAIASWYGPGFQGHRTASGEVFDEDGLTCAHKTYPFGTKLKIINPQTGKECVVTVNDRGPFVTDVDLDISRGASRAIGRLDTGPVIVEEIGRDNSYVKEVKIGDVSCAGLYRVQVGSFSAPENAEHLKMGLELNYQDVRISKVEIKGLTYNRVQVGSFRERKPALELADKLAREGYPAWVVRSR